MHANWQAEFLSADAQMQQLVNWGALPQRYKGSGTLAQGWRMASRVLARVLANLSYRKSIAGTGIGWHHATLAARKLYQGIHGRGTKYAQSTHRGSCLPCQSRPHR